MSKRIHNFNAGPATLPLPVLEKVQADFLDFQGTGMSIIEISHRSAPAQAVVDDAVARIKRLLELSDEDHVLFFQGGASTQFYMAPKNFLGPDDVADYLDTGVWSSKAIKEAEILGRKVNVAASSKDRDYCYIPKKFNFSKNAAYVHLTSNNTIRGTQWAEFPVTGGAPIIADMSSDILSRPLDISPLGMIYAGAQKNLGPAGVTLVIIRKEMLEKAREGLPSMVSYRVQAPKGSMYNTPPVFAIYVVQLVLEWLEDTVGGLKAMEERNRSKAGLLYNLIDGDGFYRGTADRDSRSLMNITFRLPSEDLEKKFIAEALAQGLGGVKGHRSVGGCRASIYNAMETASVKALADFMVEFSRTNG